MDFKNTGYSTAGRIYDVNETSRLINLSDSLNKVMEDTDKEEAKKKDLIRYSVIGVGSILIFALLTFAIRKK